MPFMPRHSLRTTRLESHRQDAAEGLWEGKRLLEVSKVAAC